MTTYQSIPGQEHEGHSHGNEEEELEDEEEPTVSTLELFSDLVIVVSIHVVAEPLEEADFSDYGLYLARVFYLWLAWHMITLVMNGAVKLKTQNCPIHNFMIFLWMAAILHMAQAFAIDNDRTAAQWYLALRLYETIIFARQVYYPYKALVLEDGSRVLAVSEGWLNLMQSYVPILSLTWLVCEFLPLSLAIYWGNHEEGTLYLPMVMTSMGLILVGFLISVIDPGDRGGKAVVSALDADHLQERYELITLIFTGELCFAAGKPGNAVGSNGVLFMAFAAYLLTFKSHPLKGHIKFWARGVLHSVIGLFLYAGVFCAIPAIGSAFARIIEEGSDDGENGTEMMEDEEEEQGGNMPASDLLCYAAGTFMIFTAMINLINVDPKDGPIVPQISSTQRGILRAVCGALMWSLCFWVPEHAEFSGAPVQAVLVPFLALLSASVEIWAVGSLRIAF